MDAFITIQGKKYSLREHTPLLKPSWIKNIQRMQNHAHAPKWNMHYGDRVEAEDLKIVRRFAMELRKQRDPGQWKIKKPGKEIILKFQKIIKHVPAYKYILAKSLAADWKNIPTMDRSMIALQAEKIVPDYMDIKKMIIFQTSGTTGHAMLVPHHPSAAASYEPMIEFVLHQYHLHPAWNPEMVATILVCSQKNTVTCATVATSWEGAGFIKVNLKSSEWGRKNFAGEYLKAMDPFFLNGDPISLAELLKRQIGLRPRAIITTAVALTIGLKKELESFYNCPVIDWYSANETGPIGYTCSENRGFHILPHDIFVEILDVKGNPLPEGKIGEITFTGGRNPFLPLLRYRTGDFAALERKACKCGDPMPRLIHFAGRASVLFKDIKGNTVNPVDVSKILKPFKYVQHQLRQNKNLSLTLRIKPVTDKQKPDEKMIHQTLEKLFGKLPINIIFEPKLGENEKGAKVIPYMSPFKL